MRGRDLAAHAQAEVAVGGRGLDQGLGPCGVSCPGLGEGFQRDRPHRPHNPEQLALAFVDRQPGVELAGLGQRAAPVLAFRGGPVGRGRLERVERVGGQEGGVVDRAERRHDRPGRLGVVVEFIVGRGHRDRLDPQPYGVLNPGGQFEVVGG